MLNDTQTELDKTEDVATDAEAATVSLSLTDLANLKQIIEVVAHRGAFQPNEMTVVGTTYNRLAAFLQAALPSEAADETEEAATEEAATEEAETEA